MIGLLSAAAVGCGGKKAEETASPAGMESASGEISDAKSLAREMQMIASGGRDFSVSCSSDIEGTLTISAGSFPVDIHLRYDTEVLASGETNEDLNISGGLDGGYNSVGGGSSVLMEGGQPFSYLVNERFENVKMKGDALADTRYVSNIFQNIADGKIEAEYSTSAGRHYITFEVSGDVLRDLLAQYCYPLIWETDGFDWNSVAANIQIEVVMDENIGPMGTINLSSSDLMKSLIMTNNSVESAEGLDLDLNIRYSFKNIENTEIWGVNTSVPEEEGELPMRQGVIGLMRSEIFDKINKVNAENFEEIETRDPVTLAFGDVTVTMTFPWEIPYYKNFHQNSPQDVYLSRSGFGNLNTVKLDTTNPKTVFDRAKEYYNKYVENDSELENPWISDIYTLDTSVGQAEILHYDFESENSYGERIHTVHYYGVLPLENGVYLLMDVDNGYNTEKGGVHLDDEMMKTLFNHCGVGGEAPTIVDTRYGSVEEYLNVPENWEKCLRLAEEMAGNQSIDSEIGVDGNRLIYTFTIPDPGAGKKINVEATAASLNLTFFSNESALEGYAAEIGRGVSGEEPKVIIIVNTFDGEKIFSEEYSAN